MFTTVESIVQLHDGLIVFCGPELNGRHLLKHCSEVTMLVIPWKTPWRRLDLLSEHYFIRRPSFFTHETVSI